MKTNIDPRTVAVLIIVRHSSRWLPDQCVRPHYTVLTGECKYDWLLWSVCVVTDQQPLAAHYNCGISLIFSPAAKHGTQERCGRCLLTPTSRTLIIVGVRPGELRERLRAFAL